MLYQTQQKFWLLVCIVFSLFIACYHDEQVLLAVQEDIDISPDDKKIAYSFCDSTGCAIYEFSLADSTSRRITPAADIDYCSPKYSPDSSKILFLARKRSQNHAGINRPLICIYHIANGAITSLPNDSLYIYEASFSADGGGIYCAAYIGRQFASPQSSPVFRCDIFSMDTGGANRRRITNFQAYSISGCAPTSDGKYLVSDIADSSHDGLYMIDCKDPNNQIQIKAVKFWDDDMGCNFYSSPAISPDGATLVVAPARRLISINFNSREASILYHSGASCLYSPRFFHSSNKIAFTQDSMQNVPGQHPETVGRCLMIIDLLTKENKKINLSNQKSF